MKPNLALNPARQARLLGFEQTTRAAGNTASTKNLNNLLADDDEPQGEPPGLIQQILNFFSKLWSPGTSDAEKLGYSYVYAEDGSLLGEYGSGGSNSTGTAQYIYLPTASGPMPIAAVIKGQTYAVHSDHLNTPRKLTQPDGQVAWQWAYSAFGDEQPTIGAKRFTSETTTPTTGATSIPEVTFNLRYPGQYFDKETKLHYNYFRSYRPADGNYTQFDPIGLRGGPNGYLYAGANPLSFIDPMGLTQADVNAAVNAARAMQPNWRFPSEVKTWSQQGKGGKNNFWDKNIYVDSKYLECLDDGEAGALLSTILHELTHFNQTWYQFGIDNMRERVTGGNSSNAQDTADALLWKNDKILADYLKNRHVDKNSCQCRK